MLESSPKLYYLFQCLFLVMIYTWLLPKTVSAFANWSLIFGNISYFVQGISFSQCFHFFRKIDNYLRGVTNNPGTALKLTMCIFITNKNWVDICNSLWIESCQSWPLWLKMKWEKTTDSFRCYTKHRVIITNLILRHRWEYITDMSKYYNVGIWSKE